MDVGQTVAASLSAPKLFVIANDLSRMQILASVDESDIGKIVAGQPVTLHRAVVPRPQFTGSVEQVRLNSTTLNNVVSYTAVVSVSNEDGKLLPGMTASVKLQTASADDVLTVPSTALRFTPPEGAKVNTPVRKARTGDSTAASNAASSAAPNAAPAAGSNGGGFPGGGFPGGPGGNNAPRRPRPTGTQPGSMARALDRRRRRHAHAALREARHLRRAEDADHVPRSQGRREHRDQRDAARRHDRIDDDDREPAPAAAASSGAALAARSDR